MPLFKYDPKIRKHHGRYSVRFYDPETRRRHEHSLGTDSKEIANRRFREICRAYELGEFDPAREKYQFGSLTLRRASNGFLAARKSSWAASTYVDYERFLNMVCEALPEDVHLRHVDPSDYRKIVDQPPSQAAKRGYYRRLRSFLNWCAQERYIKHSPLDDVQQPAKKADQRVPFLTRAEFARFIQTIDEAAGKAEAREERASLIRLSRACRFAVATGLRLNELCKLKWRDIEWESRRIHVVGKRQRYRTIPLFPDAESALGEIRLEHHEQFGVPPHPSHDVFVDLPYFDTSHDITRFLKAAGLKEKIGKGKATHALRHTFASWCVMAGVDVYAVSKWLGHSSVSTTQIYAHLAPDYAPAAAIAAFGGKPAPMGALWGSAEPSDPRKGVQEES